MAEENTATSVNQVLQKKLDNYHSELNDFVAPQEITVTITLNEYRRLISDKATSSERISTADRQRYEANERSDKFKNENERLRAELDEVKEKLGTEKTSNVNLQQQLDALEVENESLKAEVKDLKSKLPKTKK